MKTVEKNMRKAIREQIERVMRPIWDEVPQPEPLLLSPDQKERRDEINKIINSGDVKCSKTPLMKLVNLLLEEMDSPFRAEITKEFTYEPGQWVVPTTNPNTHCYPVDKPTVVLDGRLAFRETGLDESRRQGNPAPWIGNHLPRSDDEGIRYATEKEMETFTRKLKGKTLTLLYTALEQHGLL